MYKKNQNSSKINNVLVIIIFQNFSNNIIYMNHIITSSTLQTFENGKMKKHVEEEEIVNGKRINQINYDIYNKNNYIIIKGKKNNKTFSYKKKIIQKPNSFLVIWGMPTSNKMSKKKRRRSNKNKKIK